MIIKNKSEIREFRNSLIGDFYNSIPGKSPLEAEPTFGGWGIFISHLFLEPSKGIHWGNTPVVPSRGHSRDLKLTELCEKHIKNFPSEEFPLEGGRGVF